MLAAFCDGFTAPVLVAVAVVLLVVVVVMLAVDEPLSFIMDGIIMFDMIVEWVCKDVSNRMSQSAINGQSIESSTNRLSQGSYWKETTTLLVAGF